jgi:hypothetical protein
MSNRSESQRRLSSRFRNNGHGSCSGTAYNRGRKSNGSANAHLKGTSSLTEGRKVHKVRLTPIEEEVLPALSLAETAEPTEFFVAEEVLEAIPIIRTGRGIRAQGGALPLPKTEYERMQKKQERRACASDRLSQDTKRYRGFIFLRRDRRRVITWKFLYGFGPWVSNDYLLYKLLQEMKEAGEKVEQPADPFANLAAVQSPPAFRVAVAA